MLDIRQRVVLLGTAVIGVVLVLFLGLSLPGAVHSAGPWPPERPSSVRTWEESRFGFGTLPLEERVVEVAARYGIDPALLAAVIRVESGFRDDAVSPKGAQGLMQVMPDTAALLGFPDVTDPHVNLEAGSRYLAALLDQFGGDVELALAAYNAGPGAVRRWGTVPPFRQTRAFVRGVNRAYLELTGMELRTAARLVTAESE
ncbi:MAG: lytic transglycosylase domain-containing protein [Acidobacteriota bacterium]|jgi:soluble lytic murein transglycosylase-like protein